MSILGCEDCFQSFVIFEWNFFCADFQNKRNKDVETFPYMVVFFTLAELLKTLTELIINLKGIFKNPKGYFY